eukprot:TRINITY_DN22_c1_g1_i2.p1 TRINITY_DN22_c1_g1~~TRINITY_DN22_c1_g1_i2.p1  ORF type:complete len:378 (+),score=121.88 TRINITY_DN22_c1_g1_i2:169-1302(+)
MRTAVLLALFVAVAFAANPRVVSFVQKAQTSTFGKTLLGTIDLELSSNAPGDYLLNLLNGMRTTVYNDIVRANTTHSNVQESCTNDIASLQGEVANHAQAIIESKDIISKSNQKLAWDQVELGNNQRILAEAQDSLSKAHTIRNEEAAEYERKTNEINEALQTLHQGRNVIENGFRAQGALVQIANHMNNHVRKMSALIQRKQYRGRGFVALINILAQVSQDAGIQANPDSVKKVIELIQNIIDEIEKAKSIEFQAEQERIENYNTIVELLNKRINEAQANIDRLTNEINQLTQIINAHKNRISDNTRSIQIKKRQQIKRKKECNAENEQFLREAAVRQENFDLLSEALAVVNENADQFRHIVLQNSENGIQNSYAQ